MESDRSRGIFWLGILVLLIYVALMSAVLFASYTIIVGGMKIADPGTVAVIFTLIGSIVTGITGLAGMVANYYYGSSHGSAVKTEQLARPAEATKPD